MFSEVVSKFKAIIAPVYDSPNGDNEDFVVRMKETLNNITRSHKAYLLKVSTIYV